MAKRGRPRLTLDRASIAALERALARKKRAIAKLEGRREVHLARLAKVDAELAAIRGTAAPAPEPAVEKKVTRGRGRGRGRPPGRRTPGKTSLAAAISQVLAEADGSMRAAQVTDAVLAAGYQTKAKNFKQIVHSALTRHPGAARAGKGLYVAKAGRKKAAAK